MGGAMRSTTFMDLGLENEIFDAPGEFPISCRACPMNRKSSWNAMYSAYSLLNVAMGDEPEPMFFGLVRTSQTRIGPSITA